MGTVTVFAVPIVIGTLLYAPIDFEQTGDGGVGAAKNVVSWAAIIFLIPPCVWIIVAVALQLSRNSLGTADREI